MPLLLHRNERVGEIFDGLRKLRDLLVLAAALGEGMVDSAIGLLPSMLAAISARASDEEISTRPRQTVEQGVVGRACRATKIGL